MTDRELLEQIVANVSKISSEITEIKTEITGIKTEIKEMKSEITELKSDVSTLKSDVSTLKSDVSEIKMTIENEIRVNIKRVAEGHLDLSRNLKEAQIPNSELEIISIKVTTLENQMKEVRRKLEVAM